MRFISSLTIIVMLYALVLCGSARAESSDSVSETPLTSKLEILQEGDSVEIHDKIIIRIAPKGIHIKDTDVEGGYITEIIGTRGILWIEDVEVPTPDSGGTTTKRRVEIYAEGDVFITQTDIATGVVSKARCKQLYFDLLNRKGVMLDTWLKVYEPGDESFFYITAKKVRQLATSGDKTLLKIYNARVTNDSYGKPVAYLQIPRLDIEREERPEGTVHRPNKVVNVRAYNIVGKVYDVPIIYLPFAAASTLNRYFLRSISIGDSSRYGTYVLTKWDLQRLGLLDNDWDKLRLRADYYSDRGPAIGFDYHYKRPDYEGLLTGYYLRDHGKDHYGSHEMEPDTENRGRIRWLHRHYLGDGWIADLEFTKISDRGFMDEFMERELEQDKDQESLFYLHRTWKHYMFTALGKFEVNDFYTTTEYLPQVTFSVASLPFWQDRLYFSMDSQIANIRRDYEESDLSPHDQRTVRGDLNTEFAAPFGLSIFNVRPYAGFRGTFYGGNGDQAGKQRFVGYAGMKASTNFVRVFYDREGKARWRHIVKPRVEVYSAYTTSIQPENLIQYDSVDMVDSLTVASIGLRQIFQTKRGPAGNRYSFDTLIVDIELNLYSNNDPMGYYNDPRTGGRIYTGSSYAREICDNFKAEAVWRLSERLDVYGNFTYNIDNKRFDLYDVGVRWTPNDDVYVRVRNYYYRNDGSSTFSAFTNIFEYNNSLETVNSPYGLSDIEDKRNVIEFDIGYQANEKWAFGLFVQYDFEESEMQETSFVIRRYFHVWVLDIIFERDDGDDNTSIKLAFSPRSTTGSFTKRLSSTDTRGRPEGR